MLGFYPCIPEKIETPTVTIVAAKRDKTIKTISLILMISPIIYHESIAVGIGVKFVVIA